jgi:hypothetical protein
MSGPDKMPAMIVSRQGTRTESYAADRSKRTGFTLDHQSVCCGSLPVFGEGTMSSFGISSCRSKRRSRPLFALVAGAVVATALLLVASPVFAVPGATPAAVIRHQQSDPRFVYSGTWTTVGNTSASGASFKFAGSAASVTIRFIGTRLALIAKRSPKYGKAKVTLDGSSTTVDLYSGADSWQQNVYDTHSLTSGAHTVKIEWTGTKRTAATGAYVSIDAVDVNGVVTGLCQQNDPHLAYVGSWTSVPNLAASGGSFKFAGASGAGVTVHFTGVKLVWIAKKSPLYGKAKVSVDGGISVPVDLYAPSVEWRRSVWNTGLLTLGAHVVKIQWSGTKNTAATGTRINVDAFDVTGTLN